MKVALQQLPFALAFSAHKSAGSCGRFAFVSTKPTRLEPGSWQSTNLRRLEVRSVEPVSIYAVDDLPHLTELYAGLLESIGYLVRAFNHRANALTALKTDKKRPALLITDYVGLSMPVNQFIQACRFIHPGLRILMASGFNEHLMEFSGARPDRFIQKPFTVDELQQTVR